jgi:hypothetical protein
MVLTVGSLIQSLIWLLVIAFLICAGLLLNQGISLHQKNFVSLLPSTAVVVVAEVSAFTAFKFVNSQGNEILVGLGVALALISICVALIFNKRLFGLVDGIIVLLIEAVLMAAVAVVVLALYFAIKMTIPSGKRRIGDD